MPFSAKGDRAEPGFLELLPADEEPPEPPGFRRSRVHAPRPARIEGRQGVLRTAGHGSHAEDGGGHEVGAVESLKRLHMRRRALVVGLAVRRAEHLRDVDDPLRRLVARELRLHVLAHRLLIETRRAREFDDGGDRLAPLLVRHPEHERIGDVGVSLQRLLDLFRVDLLARGVDACTAAAEQVQRAVRFDRAPITRDRVANPTDRRKRSRRLLSRPCSSRAESALCEQ